MAPTMHIYSVTIWIVTAIDPRMKTTVIQLSAFRFSEPRSRFADR
jgi:hypothetical protein